MVSCWIGWSTYFLIFILRTRIPEKHHSLTHATMILVLVILILHVGMIDVTIVGRDFDKVDQFDDKIGINHILVSTESVSTCACGALCGQEGERCKSFIFYKLENMCLLYNEDLHNLQLNNKMGAKGYSVKCTYKLIYKVGPTELISSTIPSETFCN